jgi:hypothetical protein
MVKINTDLLRQQLLDISNIKEQDKEQEIGTRFEYLKNSFPSLYEKISQDSENYTLCIKMIDAIEEIQNGKISEHDASERIGTNLAEKYVYTKIPGFNKDKDLKFN